MADVSAARFCWVGRFLTFLPGEKSPYQKLSLEMSLDDRTANAPPVTYQIRLGKDLQRMMYRYLEPQDWVRVIGKQGIDERSGQMVWQATEISKLSAPQITQLQNEASLFKAPELSKTPRPVRVLICQKSSCRQRGSLVVSEVMEGMIAQSNCSEQVAIQSTGCMKRCKVGPNVVMLPGGSHAQVTPAAGRSLIQALLGVET